MVRVVEPPGWVSSESMSLRLGVWPECMISFEGER